MNFLIATFVFLFSFQPTIQRNTDGAIFARFRNIANHDMVLWWVTPYRDEEIRFFGHLPKNGGMTSFTSYKGHQFFWAPPNKQNIKSERRGYFRTVEDKILYIYDDPEDPGRSDVASNTLKELAFLDDYYKTHGKHWLSTFNRPQPTVPYIKMDDPNSPMQSVDSNQYFWFCNPQKRTKNTKSSLNKPIMDRFRRLIGGIMDDKDDAVDNTPKCQHNNVNEFEFTIESLNANHPRIYKISNFINEFEANHIIDLARKHMRRSTVGDGDVDPTRTSTSSWLTMNHTQIVESIYRRMGDVLGIDQYRMSAQAAVGNNNGVASHMEIIHFGTNQFYNRHYDNSVRDDIALHFITFQVILDVSDDFKGGETAFSLADQGKKGIVVESEAYSAVFWYNLLEDGNLDETSMYSHNRVIAGGQWMYHVSVWDPSLPLHGDPNMPHSKIYAMHDEL